MLWIALEMPALPLQIAERGGVSRCPPVIAEESTQRLFSGHAKLTTAIRRGVRELGFQAMLGVAPTPSAARVMARAEARGLQVRACLAVSELRERLSGLPIFLLDLPEKTLAWL